MSKIVKENKAKILFALDMAKGAAPLGYISKHSGIEDPRELLQQLEKDGLVRRLLLQPPILCSLSFMPLFELTGKAKKLLRQAIDHRLQQPIDVPI